MSCCNESTDFLYPLLADVFYPIVEQGAYGNMKKQWVLDRTIACSFNPAARSYKEDVIPDTNITIDNSLVGRVKSNLTVSDLNSINSLTNILLTNIRNSNGEIIYNESSGVRAGQATIFEIATMNPVVGPFGKIEYYKVVIRRSENQAVDL